MRNLSSEFYSDEFFGSKPLRVRHLWSGMIIVLADDQGRFLDSPARIKATIFPYDEDVSVSEIDTDLKMLAKHHKIFRYEAGNNGSGRKIIQIVNWWRYQNKAQWAGRSNFPPPPKWVDRIRTNLEGGVYTEINWKTDGGFMKRIPRHKPLETPTQAGVGQDARHENSKTKAKANAKANEKTQPSTQPSSHDDRSGRKDGKASKQNGLQFSQLKPAQKERGKIAGKILRAAGLRNPRLEAIMVLVATRSFIRNDELTTHLLSALASSYADEDAKNKAAIAAYRIEKNDIQPNYKDPRTWKCIPTDVLKAAGIDDLNNYIQRQKFKAFTGE